MLDPELDPDPDPLVRGADLDPHQNGSPTLYLTLFLSVWQAYRDKEERLVATAFYDLGMKLNRGSVEGRLANLSQVRYRENRMGIRDMYPVLLIVEVADMCRATIK